MNYRSTRDNGVSVKASEAIRRGISEEGGLFVPESVPWLSYNDLKQLTEADYVTRAADILGRYLRDYTADELMGCVSRAYNRGQFETKSITPLYMLDRGLYLLELWHGPTCAFKDIALQLLPQLLKTAVKKGGPEAEEKTVVILVATSGDTGKAALEGFRDVDGTKILVFYPEDGVSPMQKKQMVTQEGENVYVCGIDGNFDDAQSGVKAIFTDPRMKETLARGDMVFSSANSINWGRLVPQIVYYISSYCDLIRNREISSGEPVNFVVPTGNFGNILAGYYAGKMGIPIHKLICASNANNVLTDFIRTGVYDRNRPFYTTLSPSMDILVSSNLERLLYDLSGCDDAKVRGWMAQLASDGRYEVDDTMKNSLHENFWAGCCDDAATKSTIAEIFKKYAYVCDPHTAVALDVYHQYRGQTEDTTKTVVVSTASPFKFSGDVLAAIGGAQPEGEYERMNALAELSMCRPPRQMVNLFSKPERFTGTCEKTQMQAVILKALGIGE